MTRSLMRVPVQGAELGVEVRGRSGASSSAVLFVHGFPFDHTLWRHQMAALSRWKRIAPDLRGCGVSSVPNAPDDYSVERYARDLIQVLDWLGLEKAVVCGLSMGGYILFELLRHHARRVRAAIFCNTKSAADSLDAKVDRDRMSAVARAEGAGVIAEHMLAKLLARATLASQGQVVTELREMIARSPVPGLVGALRALRERPDSTAMLAEITIPALVIAGDDDQIAPAAGMQAMARAIPKAKFALIAGAGHVSPLEQPVAVSAAIADFLAAL